MVDKKRHDKPCKKSKVLLIIIDGASPHLVSRWANAGRLPNLANLIRDGASGTLESTIPVMSPSAFASLASGMNPGKHGIFGFIKRLHNTYHLSITNWTDQRGVPFWCILSDSGKKVVVVNMPIAYPPDKVNGVFISGMLTPEFDSRSTFPPGLCDELKENIGDYQIDVKEEYMDNREDVYLNDLFYTLKKRAECVFYLQKEHDWDLFIVVFTCIDRIQHFFWKYMDEKHPEHCQKKANKFGEAILRSYQKIDALIGEMLMKTDENTTVIVMSDHGFGPEYKELFINNWLMDNGLLKLKRDLGVYVKRILRKIGLTRATFTNVKGVLSKTGEAVNAILKVYDKLVVLPMVSWSSDVDWSKTKAYAIGDGGRIYINVKGREPCGTVAPGDEYEIIRNYLIKELYKLKDPKTGKKIIEKVWRREELYWGPFLNAAPDLVFISKDMDYEDRPGFGRAVVDIPIRESGRHRIKGILIAKGREIAKSVKINNAKIWDIAPTILYLMEVPIPSEMDGEVIREMFDPKHLKQNPIKYEEATRQIAQQKYRYSKKEEEEIKKHLKALGYLQ